MLRNDLSPLSVIQSNEETNLSGSFWLPEEVLVSSLWSLKRVAHINKRLDVSSWSCFHFPQKKVSLHGTRTQANPQEERGRSEHCEVLVRITERPRTSRNTDGFCVSSTVGGSDSTMKSESAQT